MAFNHGTTTTLYNKLVIDIEQLNREGRTISPSVLAKKYKTTTHQIASNLQHIPGVYRIKKSATTRYTYKSSVWGFKNPSEGEVNV